MTPLAVCCILGGMEQDEWTEAQVIQFAQDHGYTDVTQRKLKRFRQEGVLATPRVIHLDFGEGTTSAYPVEAGQQVLAVCRLLRQKRSFDAVRFWLWLEGSPVEISQLKESIWRLVPLSSLSIPASGRERKFAARKLARFVLRQAWKTVRSNLLRKFLQQFVRQEDQEWFLHMQMSLLYGEPVDFSRDFLSEHDPELHNALEEPADIFAYGLQVQQIRFIREGEDIAKALQLIADKQLLSLEKLRAVLFAATQEELELACTRRDMIRQLFETLDLMGYLKGPLSLFRKVFASPNMQAMEIAWLLVLEQSGYGQNVEIIQEVLRTNLPAIKRGRAFHQALQQELPQVFNELLSFQHAGLLFVEGTQQEQNAYLEHLREVYKQHQEALDAFRNCHPELFEETQDTISYEVSGT